MIWIVTYSTVCSQTTRMQNERKGKSGFIHFHRWPYNCVWEQFKQTALTRIAIALHTRHLQTGRLKHERVLKTPKDLKLKMLELSHYRQMGKFPFTIISEASNIVIFFYYLSSAVHTQSRSVMILPSQKARLKKMLFVDKIVQKPTGNLY